MGQLKLIADRLRARMNDPRLLLVSGLREDLAAIAAGFSEIDNRLESLERRANEAEKNVDRRV